MHNLEPDMNVIPTYLNDYTHGISLSPNTRFSIVHFQSLPKTTETNFLALKTMSNS